jgi:hypothetical protein
MTVFIVMTVARQALGEMVFVRSEKGFSDKSKAEEFAKTLSANVWQEIDVPKVGPIKCACEVGIYKIEVD